MIFEASFYLDQPVPPDQIMTFAEAFGGRLNRMTITDARLRSKSWRPDPGRMADALAAEFPPAQILLFQKGKDGNNNFPECHLMLNRISAAEDRDHVFSLIANVPAEDEQSVAPGWWALAGEAGWKAGNGYLMQRPIRDINYGMFSTSVPVVRTETWTRFDDLCRDFRGDRASIEPVIEGRMLRNVLRQNFMTTSLAEAVRDALKKAGLPTDGFAPFPGDRVVWTLPDPESQRAAHGVLHRKGLVWENDWFDLAGYRPAPPRAGIWLESRA
ncbi:hypothetical protein [Shinella zoogloeoides]